MIRWRRGKQNAIVVPAHRKGLYRGNRIVASFHTHPNMGKDYKQGPSELDISEVVEDADFAVPHYIGEFIISNARLYIIRPNGTVNDLGTHSQFLLREEES